MSRRANSTTNLSQPQQKNLSLPFTRILTGQVSTARIKRFRRNYESMLPPCTSTRNTQREFAKDADLRDDLDKLCDTGRYKFVTEENEKHKRHEQWALQGKHQILTQIKNNYNDVLSKINAVIHETALLQKETKQRIQAAKYQEDRAGSLKQIERNCRERLEQLVCRQNEAENSKRVWSHIRQRMEEDQVIYLKRKTELEQTFTVVSKQQARRTDTQLEVENEECRYRQTFRKTRRSVEEIINYRSTQVNQLGKLVSKKQQHHQSLEHSSRPNNDPGHENLLMVHLFLNNMLRNKCVRLRDKFELMEENFEKIKRGVMFQEQNMVGKFLTQNQSFEGMQGIITLFEDKLKQAREHQARLLATYQTMEYEHAALSEIYLGSSEPVPQEGTNVSQIRPAFRLLNITDWIHEKLQRFERSKNSSAFAWEAQTKAPQPKWCTELNLGASQPFDQHLVGNAVASFRELCQKISKTLTEKSAAKIKRKPFKTSGISIKKQLFRLGSEEQRQLRAEKENFLQANQIERDWLKEVRSQAKLLLKNDRRLRSDI